MSSGEQPNVTASFGFESVDQDKIVRELEDEEEEDEEGAVGCDA